MKPIVIAEAVDFIKRKSLGITRILTKQHHMMIDQFVEFKTRNT